MPKIVFDVLVPGAETDQLGQRFARLAERASQVENAEITVGTESSPAVAAEVEHELRSQMDGEAVMVRYLVEIRGAVRSLNQLAMVFARLLTPAAELPREPTLLENEAAFELPAVYPWTVSIHA